jgi:hypothetical protein
MRLDRARLSAARAVLFTSGEPYMNDTFPLSDIAEGGRRTNQPRLGACPLQMALMYDQLKPDRLTWRNDNILRLTAETPYRIAAGGHLENGVSKIVSRFRRDDLSVRRIDDCYLVPHQSGARFSVFFDQLPRDRFHLDMASLSMEKCATAEHPQHQNDSHEPRERWPLHVPFQPLLSAGVASAANRFGPGQEPAR